MPPNARCALVANRLPFTPGETGYYSLRVGCLSPTVSRQNFMGTQLKCSTPLYSRRDDNTAYFIAALAIMMATPVIVAPTMIAEFLASQDL